MSPVAEIKSVQLSLRGPSFLEGLTKHDIHFTFFKSKLKDI